MQPSNHESKPERERNMEKEQLHKHIHNFSTYHPKFFSFSSEFHSSFSSFSNFIKKKAIKFLLIRKKYSTKKVILSSTLNIQLLK